MDICRVPSSIGVGIAPVRTGPDSRAMTDRPPTHQTTHQSPPRRHVAAPDPIARSEPIRSPGARRILVVDGDHRVRDSLADLIGLAEGVEVVGTCSQPGETLEAIKRLDPDVVVIDPYLPDLDAGLALIRTLRARRRAIRIVATCRDDGLGPLALAAGADACVDRCADPTAFQEAVMAAACPDAAPIGDAGHAGHPLHDGAATPDAGSGGIL
jgi:CheY-like chemotaxis protein